jgi:MioC protein
MQQIALMAGTVYGGALEVANLLQQRLAEMKFQSRLFYPANLDEVAEFAADHWLIVTSTTGQGDIPDDLLPFFLQVNDKFPMLTGKSWAIVALGDSSYGETYCGAGQQWHQLLSQLNGAQSADMLRIDAAETLLPEEPALGWLEQHYQNVKL